MGISGVEMKHHTVYNGYSSVKSKIKLKKTYIMECSLLAHIEITGVWLVEAKWIIYERLAVSVKWSCSLRVN